MKKIMFIIILICVPLLMFVACEAKNENEDETIKRKVGKDSNGICWQLVDNELKITGEGEMEAYDADYMEGVYSTEIPWGLDIEQVVIESVVVSIGDNAFYGCNKLANIQISNTVKGIGVRAFKDCTWLTKVTIPEGVTNVGMAAFAHCTSLESITIPESVIEIYMDAFDSSGITTIYGKAGSYAETFANEKGYEFIAQ